MVFAAVHCGGVGDGGIDVRVPLFDYEPTRRKLFRFRELECDLKRADVSVYHIRGHPEPFVTTS